MGKKNITLDETINKEESILERFDKLPEKEKIILLQAIEQKPKGSTYKLGKNHFKYGLISDTHIGNINYDPSLMKFAVKQFNKEKVDFVAHAGDIVDGWYQIRPTQIFELNAIGFDQQVKMAVEELSQIKQPLYFISANHEYNTYMRGAGVEIGHVLEDKLKSKGNEVHFLGNAEGDIIMPNESKIKLLHPDTGAAYALSYRGQKIIESLEGGRKPNILNIGNHHKAIYFFYRNTHIFESGTLENQTKFMKGKHIAAMKGFWIIDVCGGDKGGIDYISPKFYPSYE